MIEFSFKNKDIAILVAKVKVATVHTEGLQKIAKVIPAFNYFITGLIAQEVAIKQEQTVSEIDEFEKAYFKLRDEYYGKKSAIRTFKDAKHRQHILAAIEICKSHEVSYEKFLYAQIAGLKLMAAITGKNDHFPSPGHLSTTEAEKRLLEHSTTRTERPTHKLTKEELELPLKRNSKFVKYWDAFLHGGDITLKEALYVEACMKARNKDVPAELEDFIIKKIKE